MQKSEKFIFQSQFGDEVERSVREVNALLGELPEEAGKPRRMFASESSEDVKVNMLLLSFMYFS